MAMPGPPPLPMRFPCWCRAVYSWGGESKRDLGFMEGDLIECLNAGDGSWWTGRLFRDRRMVGAFPSNFVEVLPEDFRPVTRSVSPLPGRGSGSGSGGGGGTTKAVPQKSKTFRKPFEAYAKAPHYTTAKQPETFAPGAERARDTSVASVASAGTGTISKGPAAGAAYRARHGSGQAGLAGQTGQTGPAGQAPASHVRNNSSLTNTNSNINGSVRGSKAPLWRAPSPAPPPQQPPIQQAPPPHTAYGGSRSPSPMPMPTRMSVYNQEPLYQGQSQQPLHYQPQQPYVPPHQPQQQQQHYQPQPPPPQHYQPPRSPSPAPPQQYRPRASSRAASPAPSITPYRRDSMIDTGMYQPYRPPSAAGLPLDSPPPPPPPPHRQLGYPGPGPGYHTPRAPSPMPSPGVVETGLTPSPLREAMDDVMEQLHTLGMSRDEARSPDVMGMGGSATPAAFDAWSPDSFNTVHQQSRRQGAAPPPPPPVSVGIDEGYETYSGSGHSSQNSTKHVTGVGVEAPEEEEKLPQLSNYVERMESRLRTMHQKHQQVNAAAAAAAAAADDEAPTPPPKRMSVFDRPKSSMAFSATSSSDAPEPAPAPGVKERQQQLLLRHRKSAYDVGRQVLSRTFTNKTNSTTASSGAQSTATTSSTNTQSTNRSLMSGVSASGLSATSAGSMARKKHSRAQSALGLREWERESEAGDRPDSPFTGVTYHSSHASDYHHHHQQQQQSQSPLPSSRVPRPRSQVGFHSNNDDMPGLGGLSGLGGLTAPKSPKKGTNFLKKILESAKTGVASSRGSIAMTGFGNSANTSGGGGGGGGGVGKGIGNNSNGGVGHGYSASSPMSLSRNTGNTAKSTGLGGSVDWVQVRRDVNRSNSLSRIERNERRDRCQMLDYPTLDPVDELYNTIDGDEGADGMPLAEATNFGALNLSQVDKTSRFINGLPPTVTAAQLATTYVCRPYRSTVQRVRAIFTWVAESIVWEDDYDGDGDGGMLDTRRVLQTRRGSAHEYAVLVAEMCDAAGIVAEVVRGYLKAPGDMAELGIMPRSNHYWNAVLVDGEWRVMDCCVASPSFPRRSTYASGGGSSTTADPWWFLVQPSEACYTHIPEHHSQQHLCPPVAHEILQNLPCAGPPYFCNGLQLMDFNTSLLRIEDLEMVHVRFSVPADVEVAAEVEVRALSRDADGDLYESGDVVAKRALAQADWIAGGIKRYTVKGVLPGDEGTGILKVYAGKRGLMHSIKDIPHPLAFSLPIVHTGENPSYDFVLRHPTPHAQRHDLYVVQPQCQRLALNNTFVFAIRQHPSSVSIAGPGMPGMPGRAPSPSPFARPSSAMSMQSNLISAAASISGSSTTSGSGTGSGSGSKKPAKLAIQTPGGKILRLMRKEDRSKSGAIGVGYSGGGRGGGGDDDGDGGTWETIIKCSERGVWRGLVLADRTARWCVFAEWVCQ